jgi:uncharacterized protein YutE (UPF0331/DUF86 family)
LVDPDVVRRRLRQIERRVAALRTTVGAGLAAYLAAPDVQAQVERHLQVALQAAIDVALHVVAEDTAETPETYGSAFVLLATHDVIPAPLADRLRLAAGLRNVLVHGYLEVDPARVFAQLGELDDLVELASHVEAYLHRTAQP